MRTRRGAVQANATPQSTARAAAPVQREQRLLSSLSTYAAYHSSPWNKVVHIMFVPAIWWSAALALHAAGPLGGALGLKQPVTGAALFWLFCSAVYVYLETPVGLSASLFYFALLKHTEHVYSALGQSAALQLALAVHLVSWFMQVVIGHALIERRRPALVDSLVSSLILAPLFVVLECFFSCGYKPSLHAKLQAETQHKLGTLRARDSEKSS